MRAVSGSAYFAELVLRVYFIELTVNGCFTDLMVKSPLAMTTLLSVLLYTVC